MILSCSWISLPCLSSSVIIRFFPRLCVFLTFFKLLDASIVARISSKLVALVGIGSDCDKSTHYNTIVHAFYLKKMSAIVLQQNNCGMQ